MLKYVLATALVIAVSAPAVAQQFGTDNRRQEVRRTGPVLDRRDEFEYRERREGREMMDRREDREHHRRNGVEIRLPTLR